MNNGRSLKRYFSIKILEPEHMKMVNVGRVCDGMSGVATESKVIGSFNNGITINMAAFSGFFIVYNSFRHRIRL